MKSLCVATVLLLTACPATAQTLEETFDKLGSKLQEVQKSLPPAPPTTQATTVELQSSTPIYTQPSATSATQMKLEARAPVTIQGIENGFARVTTPSFPGVFYVPEQQLPAGISDQPSLRGPDVMLV